jgi:gliding motility-associated-like protein
MKLYTARFIVFIFLSLFSIESAYAQYADQHYIAPSPWVYWTGAYEIVLSTEFSGVVNVSVTKSDGTPMVNTTVSQGNPTAFRFTGNPAGVLNHPINTILNDAGILVTANQPVAVNVRNVTSDQIAIGNCIDSKGNSSLTSFGNEGLGIGFRLGYYRSDYNGVGYCYALPVVNCVMAIANGTDVILNGSVITTLNAGQSYIFLAPLGSLLEASGPIVVNSGAYVDSPQGCGDGVVDQVAPTSVLDTAYFVVRGLGTAGAATDLPEQTTIVATRASTNVRVDRYNATGGLIGTTNYVLANAGSFVSFHHGDGATQYSCSHIVGDKPIAVYAGSAVSCEVDMSFVPPVGPCAGSFRVETTNFKSYLNTTLPYNGYVLIEDPTAVVFMNGVNLESITAPRFQIGTTGYYMIRFNDTQIGFPANMLINSAERMNISIVQQGGGFSMSAFFSSFNQVLEPPTLAPNGTCGSATFTAEPGYAPYQWFFDEVAIPGATGQTYVATVSGFYSVAGTRPCGLTKPSLPVYFDDSTTTPDLTTTLPDTLKCNVASVTLTASSITPGATYSWGGANTNNTFTVSVPGSYYVTVTEPINNCQIIDTLVVAQNITPPNVTINAHGDLNCNNASINLVAASSTAGTSFNWGGGNLTNTRNVTAAGTYTVSATDGNNGCTATASSSVASIPLISLTETHVNVACFGANTGSINVSVSGGQAPFTYAWSNAAITEDLVNISAGTYTLTVTDNQTCNATIQVIITQPAAALVLDTNKTHVLCFGAATGAIDLIPTGGTTAYTYLWSNAAVSQDLNNVVAGQYNVTVTDANSCTATLSATLTQPASALSATSVVTNVSCFGGNNGAINVTPAGGTTPYVFIWSNAAVSEDISGLIAGSYTVTITDANGCTLTHSKTIAQPTDLTLTLNPTAVACFGDATGGITSTTNGGVGPYGYSWSNAAITANLTNVITGNYTLTVTDANGCQKNSSATVTQPAAALALDTNKTHVLCFAAATGAIDLIPTGGTTAYTYLWSNAAVSQDLNNVVAGQYNVTVTDANSCTATLSATLTEPGSALSVTSVVTDVNCFGGSDGAMDVSPLGATSPYTYLWSNNATSEDIAGVVAGNYTVTVTDANGCTLTNSNAIAEPTQLTVSFAISGINCNSDTDADIVSTATGGSPTYTYLWSDASTGANLTGVGEGSYTLTVTDQNSCTVSQSAVITIPPAIGYTLVTEDVSCFGFNDGYLELNAFGGTGTINAAWAGGEYPDNSFSGIAPGNYTIVLTDDNGCDTSVAITVTEPLPVSVDILPIDTLRIGLVDTLETNAVTNPGNVSYYWEPSDGLDCDNCPSTEVEVYWDTRYVVTLDNNGCTATDTVWVYVNSEHILYMPNAFSPNGDGINDVYYVYAEGVKRIVWSVFDRWGEVVFTSADINTGWDGTMKGKKLQPSVFVINVYIEFLDLTSERHHQSILLLR